MTTLLIANNAHMLAAFDFYYLNNANLGNDQAPINRYFDGFPPNNGAHSLVLNNRIRYLNANPGGTYGKTEFLAQIVDMANWEISSNVTSFYNLFNADRRNTVENQAVLHNTALKTVLDADFTGDFTGWDVSNVKDFRGCFQGWRFFTKNVSGWNMSSAVNTSYMFYNCPEFDVDLLAWQTGNVQYMAAMFYGCTLFNQDLSNWDVSKCKNFTRMFESANSFNQNLSSWNVSSGTDFSKMFKGAVAFTGTNLANWSPSKAENMTSMFEGATALTATIDLSTWNLKSAVFFDNGGKIEKFFPNTVNNDPQNFIVNGTSYDVKKSYFDEVILHYVDTKEVIFTSKVIQVEGMATKIIL